MQGSENPSMESRTEPPFKTYLEYVTTLAKMEPQFEWLFHFLSKEGAEPSETVLILADSIDNRLHVSNFSSDPSGFQKEVQYRPVDVQTRIVLVCYEQTWSVNRDVVDKVGLAFNVDPTFLWEHFDHLAAEGDKLSPIDTPRWRMGSEDRTPVLISQCDSVVIVNGVYSMSVLFQHERGKDQTIVAFARMDSSFSSDPKLQYFSPSTLYATMGERSDSRPLLERLLQRLSKEEVDAANRKPVEYIYPYARLSAMRYSRHLELVRSEVNFERSAYEDWEVDHLRESRTLSRSIISELTASYRSLSRHSDPGSNDWRSLQVDYDEILAQARQFEEDIKDHMTTCVGIMTLKESKKSIQLADSVRRITQLAFIFVPLTFVTSIFGMNLEGFGTGNIKTWVFLVVASAVTITVFALLIMSRHFPKWYKTHFKSLRVILALSKYLPREAFWFSIFCLYHRPKTQGQLLHGLGLYYRLLSNGDDWLPPTAFRTATDERLQLNVKLSPFWFEKAEVVWKFFLEHGWEHRTYYWRLKEGAPKLRAAS